MVISYYKNQNIYLQQGQEDSEMLCLPLTLLITYKLSTKLCSKPSRLLLIKKQQNMYKQNFILESYPPEGGIKE